MFELSPSSLPALPLVLWEPPPGLELILRQEGIATVRIRDPHTLAFRVGRFVLYDGRNVSAATVRATLTADHVPLDVDLLRREEGSDPFLALIDSKAAPATWRVGRWALTERVARVPKAKLRRRLLERLRQAVTNAGGLWARLAPFPFPYRSAFNFRADLDERVAADYARFACARRPLVDCCTHFVSTHAYGGEPTVLGDLRGCDTQSHGHYHVVYRDRESNRRNLERAHELLVAAGIDPVGFAAPHGRWNAGLDSVLADLGYRYSSDFQLGYDDFPFFPWREDRFSSVLQIPIHPICEGLFLEAGARSGRVIADHLAAVVRAHVDSGEPAFVYGHPERRLGRFPEVLAALDGATSDAPLLWRVTLTEFAEWWHWRDSRALHRGPPWRWPVRSPVRRVVRRLPARPRDRPRRPCLGGPDPRPADGLAARGPGLRAPRLPPPYGSPQPGAALGQSAHGHSQGARLGDHHSARRASGQHALGTRQEEPPLVA